MILCLLVLIVGGGLLFGCLYWFMQAGYNHKGNQMCIALVLVLVLTFAVPMLAVHTYHM